MLTFWRGLWRRFLRSVTRHGLLGAVFRWLFWPVECMIRAGQRQLGSRNRTAVKGTPGDDFDEQFGVDTAPTSEIQDLAAIQSANYRHAFQYQTVNTEVVREMLRSLALPYGDYVFCDLGSGKGKILFVAAEFPFRRIVGVEFCQPLHAIAERNIASYRNPAQKCFDIQSIYGDATFYPIPADPLVVFLFNPFDGAVLRKVIANLSESLRLRPRKIVILYYNPLYADLFSETGWIPRRRGKGYLMLDNDCAVGDLPGQAGSHCRGE